jgi:uncharacterized protein YutE (UPF0331/DUF86 family)
MLPRAFRVTEPAHSAPREPSFVVLVRRGVRAARRLAAAAGFRSVVAHANESIDMERVHRAASHGPADLRAFLTTVRDRLREPA